MKKLTIFTKSIKIKDRLIDKLYYITFENYYKVLQLLIF